MAGNMNESSNDYSLLTHRIQELEKEADRYRAFLAMSQAQEKCQHDWRYEHYSPNYGNGPDEGRTCRQCERYERRYNRHSNLPRGDSRVTNWEVDIGFRGWALIQGGHRGG